MAALSRKLIATNELQATFGRRTITGCIVRDICPSVDQLAISLLVRSFVCLFVNNILSLRLYLPPLNSTIQAFSYTGLLAQLGPFGLFEASGQS